MQPICATKRRHRTRVALLLPLLASASWIAATQPVVASSTDIGGGVAGATVAFDGHGVPLLIGDATSFTLTGGVPTFAINTPSSQYAGSLTLVGRGSSPNESAIGGSGTLTLTDAHGSNSQGSINCADPTTGSTLTGPFSLAGTGITATLRGSCVLNGASIPVSFVFHGEAEPIFNPATTPTSITNAAFAGEFSVQLG